MQLDPTKTDWFEVNNRLSSIEGDCKVEKERICSMKDDIKEIWEEIKLLRDELKAHSQKLYAGTVVMMFVQPVIIAFLIKFFIK